MKIKYKRIQKNIMKMKKSRKRKKKTNENDYMCKNMKVTNRYDKHQADTQADRDKQTDRQTDTQTNR